VNDGVDTINCVPTDAGRLPLSLKYTVTADFTRERLDKFIMAQNHEQLYSRSLVEKLISNGSVFINGVQCDKKGRQLRESDVVTVHLSADLSAIVEPLQGEAIPLQIVYEDEWLAIIDKPAGLAVHPGAGRSNGTLVNALLYHFNQNLSNITDSAQHRRPGIVHRLDKDTSGLMVIAKDDRTHKLLSDIFMLRGILKKYLCICCGVPEPPCGQIDLSISRHKTARQKMAVIKDGKEAHTTYKVISDFEYFSLLEVTLSTGRTHQIRVHLEAINHPVLGDEVYSSHKRSISYCSPNLQKIYGYYFQKNLHRQALHSYQLGFSHPVTADRLFFQSEMPTDMTECVKFLERVQG